MGKTSVCIRKCKKCLSRSDTVRERINPYTKQIYGVDHVEEMCDACEGDLIKALE